MDVTIASIHISVHRQEQEKQQREPARSQAEREYNLSRRLAQVERQRDEARTWLMMNGGR